VTPSIDIQGRQIDVGKPVFIIAELSANHRQNIEIAERTLLAIKDSGADAVKFQTYTPDTITIDCANEHFQVKQGTIWDGRTLYQLYEEAYTPWEWQPRLKELADDLGLICFSTPFDNSAVDFLESVNVPAYKVASFEITDIPLIEYIASRQKPVIISTGIATLADIEEALGACKRVGNDQIALLKCTSSYPAPFEEANLRTIEDMSKRFHTVVGLSDHTLGISAPIAAVALGASIIEKHFILDRDLGGPDASFSLEPDEFRTLVNAIREVEKALGKVDYELSEQVRRSRELSRSLFVVQDIEPGNMITGENVRSIRPGYGLHPRNLSAVLGKKTRNRVGKGTPLKWEHIED
jgi:pseudaminic acid synthase